MGLFQHCGRSAYCNYYLQQVPTFISRGATPHTDARDLYHRRQELLPMNFASKSVIHENLRSSFTCRKAGTWDILFYLPSEGRHTGDFPDARKIQRLPGLNLRTRVTVASMLTTRSPKPSLVKFKTLMVLSKLRLKFLSFMKEVLILNLVKMLENGLLVMDVKQEEEIFCFRK